MKALVLIALACACATAPGPQRPDESHRMPVNRTVPAEVAGTLAAEPTKHPERNARHVVREDREHEGEHRGE